MLPPSFLDPGLDNFVETPDGLQFIDQEWHAAGGVSWPLVRTRALWKLAEAVIGTGVVHPWPSEITIDALTIHFTSMLDAELTVDDLDRWRDAEADLMGRVTGESAIVLVDRLERIGRYTRVDYAVEGYAPVSAMRRQLGDLQTRLRTSPEQRLDQLDGTDQALAARVDQLEGLLERFSRMLDELSSFAPVRAARRVRDSLRRPAGG